MRILSIVFSNKLAKIFAVKRHATSVKHLFAVFILLGFSQLANALAPLLVGTWQSYDDKTHLKKGQVTFSYHGGTNSFVGYITKVTPAAGYTPKEYCDKCPKMFKGKKIEGMLSIWGLEQQMNASGNPTGRYENGYLLDPVSGKIYRVNIEVSPSGKSIKVRAYIGVSAIGRTQTWRRVD